MMPQGACGGPRVALVVLSCTALALATGVVGSTFALFNAETQNAGSAFAGGWIGAADGLTATRQRRTT